MTYSINWTLESEQTFYRNLEYLEQDWTYTVMNEFLDRVEDVISKIKINPQLYPLYKRDVRKCVINERIVLYYRIVENKTIDLLTFWSTYQNPDNLEL